MNEYVYLPMKAAHTHTQRDIKVYKIDRGQFLYTEKKKRKKNYIMLFKFLLLVLCLKLLTY